MNGKGNSVLNFTSCTALLLPGDSTRKLALHFSKSPSCSLILSNCCRQTEHLVAFIVITIMMCAFANAATSISFPADEVTVAGKEISFLAESVSKFDPNTIPKKNIALNFILCIKMLLYILFDQEHFPALEIIAAGHAGNINAAWIISRIPFYTVLPAG